MNIIFFLLYYLLSNNFLLNEKPIEINQINDKNIIIQNETPECLLKLDDFCFVNKNVGWLIRGLDSLKKVYKTKDGGKNWYVVSQNTYNVFRSIGFRDSINGFIGTLDSDILLRTSNGGFNWNKVENIKGNPPKGICGLYILDSKNIFGCGRYDGPAHYIKSSDGGENWKSISLSSKASLLVDCYFFDNLNGIVVGGISTGDYFEGYPIILRTSDSGINWQESYRGNIKGEICWKISFINNNTGFVSIQSFDNNSNEITYLKTINGGKTWEIKKLSIEPGKYESLGIFFLNENIGMIGGMRFLENGYVLGESYFTNDSGINWQKNENYININRIRKINNEIFASGKYFYKIKLP